MPGVDLCSHGLHTHTQSLCVSVEIPTKQTKTQERLEKTSIVVSLYHCKTNNHRSILFIHSFFFFFGFWWMRNCCFETLSIEPNTSSTHKDREKKEEFSHPIYVCVWQTNVIFYQKTFHSFSMEWYRQNEEEEN